MFEHTATAPARPASSAIYGAADELILLLIELASMEARCAPRRPQVPPCHPVPTRRGSDLGASA